MKHTFEILINKPISLVIKKMNSIDNIIHWQEGFINMEHIYGNPNELGAKMKLNYSFGNRKMEVIETITKQNLPDELHTTYASKGLQNIQENYFKTTKEDYTIWVCKNNFQPTNFKMSIMLLLIPGAFKKHTKTYMTNFKRFVEKGTSVHTSK
ncbi:SRPBCC family protein [Winogradskyella undariae]|uniref:SRPBCC family protein n=1 Tax=Winogradskyella TaxID=286104 RepID=UPI00156BA27E|nr:MULTISPECIES: SRPBCC family protein [Winogradskyella]NRR90818.1 SRPBCC family protein [Winogradskyella undariae]QXP79411.1 SRPBCC family protein [Winogradskyella sp. HaHa_3_26]